MFSDATRDRFPEASRVLLIRLTYIVDALRDGYRPASFPQTKDPVDFFNENVDFGVSIYRGKLLELFVGVSLAIEQQTYTIYAQCGRAILENIATIRYYSRHEHFGVAQEAWSRKTMTDAVLRQANETLDRFIRGNRFAWDAFVEGRFLELSKKPYQEHLTQINSATCLQKWYKESPSMESLYDLFCDLVHPNLGSNLLVLGISDERLTSGPDAKSTALPFIIPTLAGLISAYGDFAIACKTLKSYRLPAHKI